MKARTLISLLLAVTLTTISVKPAAAQATTIPMLPGTAQPISVTFGNQTNPHVACNIASYTSDDFEGTSAIKYFDFATSSEHTVPGNGLDRLSATDGQRIAFTQLDFDGDHVLVYDIATQTTTSIPGNRNFFPVIGGNLIAFMHGAPSVLNGSADLQVYDQNTGSVTSLTNDALLNTFPQVSADGSVIVWEKCQVDGTGCDIYSATQTGPGAFTTRLLTGAGEDHFPTTNGQTIAYVSRRNGETDIYLQRVGGSTEMHLAIPGEQRDLRMSGNLLVFESETTPFSYDIFLYDLSSARLYQVTNTPDSETLSDIVVGCNGVNRIVYSMPGTFGDFDVWGFNFQLDDSVDDQLNDLIALVQSFNLHDGTESSLITKLQYALAAVNASDTATACDSLTAFINASQAQSGKKLTANQVNQLVAAATQIKTDLGCQ